MYVSCIIHKYNDALITMYSYALICIIEKRPKETFETEYAYSYLLDGRGQRLTDLLGL